MRPCSSPGSPTSAAAKTVNTVVGAVYLLLGIVGFFLVGTALNILALNTADHFLHLASAIVLLGVGLAADKSVRTVNPRHAPTRNAYRLTPTERGAIVNDSSRSVMALASLGVGLVHLAVGAGSPLFLAILLVGFGIAELGWGIALLARGRVRPSPAPHSPSSLAPSPSGASTSPPASHSASRA